MDRSKLVVQNPDGNEQFSSRLFYNHAQSKYLPHYHHTVCGLRLAGTACKDDYNLPYQPIESYTRIYMPQAVNGPIVRTLKITDSVQSLTYGANYGGQGYPDADIPVTFTVDNGKVDSFNTANKTSYGGGGGGAVLPEGSYTLSDLSTVIPKGQVSTAP